MQDCVLREMLAKKSKVLYNINKLNQQPRSPQGDRLTPAQQVSAK
jgi:hypothetical protein